ncbi:MAG: hypothetical protein QG673_1482 [Pseudomonadota bacterium]|nr:hypothetical protein [Pseudomonadota bacterium]
MLSRVDSRKFFVRKTAQITYNTPQTQTVSVQSTNGNDNIFNAHSQILCPQFIWPDQHKLNQLQELGLSSYEANILTIALEKSEISIIKNCTLEKYNKDKLITAYKFWKNEYSHNKDAPHCRVATKYLNKVKDYYPIPGNEVQNVETILYSESITLTDNITREFSLTFDSGRQLQINNQTNSNRNNFSFYLQECNKFKSQDRLKSVKGDRELHFTNHFCLQEIFFKIYTSDVNFVIEQLPQDVDDLVNSMPLKKDGSTDVEFLQNFYRKCFDYKDKNFGNYLPEILNRIKNKIGDQLFVINVKGLISWKLDQTTDAQTTDARYQFILTILGTCPMEFDDDVYPILTTFTLNKKYEYVDKLFVIFNGNQNVQNKITSTVNEIFINFVNRYQYDEAAKILDTISDMVNDDAIVQFLLNCGSIEKLSGNSTESTPQCKGIRDSQMLVDVLNKLDASRISPENYDHIVSNLIESCIACMRLIYNDISEDINRVFIILDQMYHTDRVLNNQDRQRIQELFMYVVTNSYTIDTKARAIIKDKLYGNSLGIDDKVIKEELFIQKYMLDKDSMGANKSKIVQFNEDFKDLVDLDLCVTDFYDKCWVRARHDNVSYKYFAIILKDNHGWFIEKEWDMLDMRIRELINACKKNHLYLDLLDVLTVFKNDLNLEDPSALVKGVFNFFMQNQQYEYAKQIIKKFTSKFDEPDIVEFFLKYIPSGNMIMLAGLDKYMDKLSVESFKNIASALVEHVCSSQPTKVRVDYIRTAFTVLYKLKNQFKEPQVQELFIKLINSSKNNSELPVEYLNQQISQFIDLAAKEGLY